VSTAGYSGTPLVAKLGIAEGSTVAVVAAPEGFEDLLEGMPAGVRLRRPARGHLDLAVAFVTRRAGLVRRLPHWAGPCSRAAGRPLPPLIASAPVPARAGSAGTNR